MQAYFRPPLGCAQVALWWSDDDDSAPIEPPEITSFTTPKSCFYHSPLEFYLRKRLQISNMCCITTRRENSRQVKKPIVSGWAGRQNPPRNHAPRNWTMRPLASLIPHCECLNPYRLRPSLNWYYINICSDFQVLGRCPHVVIGRRSATMFCNRLSNNRNTTLCSHVEHCQYTYNVAKLFTAHLKPPKNT